MRDLDAAAFPPGRVARTLMAHLGAVVLRDGAERSLTLSAGSSARSFHAVESSLRDLR